MIYLLRKYLSLVNQRKDIPIVVAKNVLKYPEQVREFLDNGYWWMNRCLDSNIRPGKSIDFGFDVENIF